VIQDVEFVSPFFHIRQVNEQEIHLLDILKAMDMKALVHLSKINSLQNFMSTLRISWLDPI